MPVLGRIREIDGDLGLELFERTSAAAGDGFDAKRLACGSRTSSIEWSASELEIAKDSGDELLFGTPGRCRRVENCSQLF